MTQKQIRKKRDEFEKKLKDLQHQVEDTQTAWRRLQAECKHPDGGNQSIGGESTFVCPDCSYMV